VTEKLRHTAGAAGRAAPLVHVYSVHRPHTALAGQPPISRLAMNSLLGNDI
jgi:hypothetical protein